MRKTNLFKKCLCCSILFKVKRVSYASRLYCSNKCYQIYRTHPNIAFWPKIVKTATCWNWIGGIDKDGYAITTNNIRVSRLSYAMHKGKIPDGLIIRHTCDNRRCVNPSHLITGTFADNAVDRDSRGRQIRGIKNRTRVSHLHVGYANDMHNLGMNYADIGNNLEIKPSTLYQARKRYNK